MNYSESMHTSERNVLLIENHSLETNQPEERQIYMMA